MSRMNEPLAVGRVIGEVVDAFTPSVKLSVTYNLNKMVCNGHELMPNVITSKPRVDIGGEDMRSAYTLVTLSPTLHLLCYMSLYIHIYVFVHVCVNFVFS